MNQIIEVIENSEVPVYGWSESFLNRYDLLKRSSDAIKILEHISGGQVTSMLADILSEERKDELASKYKEVKTF